MLEPKTPPERLVVMFIIGGVCFLHFLKMSGFIKNSSFYSKEMGGMISCLKTSFHIDNLCLSYRDIIE